jgi:hypothetical protein
MRDLLELRPCSVSSVDFEPNPDADSRLRCVAPRTIAGRCELRTFETAQRETTPAHFTSFVRVHGHSSQSSRSALHQFGLLSSHFHSSTTDQHQHCSASSSRHIQQPPAIKDPAHHSNWLPKLFLARRRRQLIPRQYWDRQRLIRKRRTSRANSTAQPAHSAQRRCNFRPARVRADVSP